MSSHDADILGDDYMSSSEKARGAWGWTGKERGAYFMSFGQTYIQLWLVLSRTGRFSLLASLGFELPACEDTT